MKTNTQPTKKKALTGIEFADKVTARKGGVWYHIPSVGWMKQK